MGKSINLMISPLPRNKRAKNPNAGEAGSAGEAPEGSHTPKAAQVAPDLHKPKVAVNEQPSSGGLNSPFANLDINQ
jgi:hypothetical protein